MIFTISVKTARITFDMNIRASEELHLFFDKDLSFRPILSLGTHILEVKYDEFLPAFIRDSLQICDLQQTAFSKYYYCRRFMGGVMSFKDSIKSKSVSVGKLNMVIELTVDDNSEIVSLWKAVTSPRCRKTSTLSFNI